MKQTVKESARSAEVRVELRDEGYKIMWDVQRDLTRISYATNGYGKAILLLEHAVDMKWQAWDIYRQLTPDNNIAKTYTAFCMSTRTRVNENNETNGLEVSTLRHQHRS